MPRTRSRHRSSSGGSFTEMTLNAPSTLADRDPSAAEELFRIILNLSKNHGDRSLLHNLDSPAKLAFADALLQRAYVLEAQTHTSENHSSKTTSSATHPSEQLWLQPNEESGYTPLHEAILQGNLPAILWLLRHAIDSGKRLTQRPMQLLQQAESATSSINKIQRMVQAVDNEGLTPLELLGRLQQTTLDSCRASLSNRDSLVRLARNQQRGSEEEEQGQDELMLLTEHLNLLEEDHDESFLLPEETYGCEVLTFGRANHCALGVPRSDTTASHPQRIQELALSQVGPLRSAVAVAAAAHHTLVLTRNGYLYACGLGKGGRLGTGDEQHRPILTRVLGPLSRRTVVDMSAAENHSLCVTSDGIVYAFGSNRFGQLGVLNGDEAGCNRIPRRVDYLKQIPCVNVAAGDRHSVVLSRDGEVYTFGDSSSGQLGRLGRRTAVVQRVEALWNAQPRKLAIAVSASEQSTLVLVAPAGGGLPINQVYSWGHGNRVPTKVNFDTGNVFNQERRQQGLHFRDAHVNPVAIASAKYHNAAITEDGRVYTWGFHSEPLGTNRSKQHNASTSSTAITSPQLVTAMLPENGGGRAVAVSASELHTAVLTDSGHLYTFGATYRKGVMGHEGQRWQPCPKKVLGVHRAIGVAAAKEHTVLLIGTASPPLPSADSFKPSLENLAARKVAEHLDLFNVIPVLITAHRVDCNLLKEYCHNFVRLNLDGVLTLGRKSEMNCYLKEFIADGEHLTGMKDRDLNHHPLIYDFVTAGQRILPGHGEPNIDAWQRSCQDILQRLPASLQIQYRSTFRRNSFENCAGMHGRNRALSVHGEKEEKCRDFPSSTADVACSERCLLLTANMGLRTPRAVLSKVDSLSKEIRSVKKRLGQIARLEETTGSLTPDQREKLLRKPLFEADLTILEPAMQKAMQRLQEMGLSRGTHPKAATSGVRGKSSEKEDAVAASEVVQETGEEEEEASFRCEVCMISCPDVNSFALHRSGRKHRNRVAQAEQVERKLAATSIIEEKRRQTVMGTRENPSLSIPLASESSKAWNASIPKYRLPPPPHFLPTEEAPEHSIATEINMKKVGWAGASTYAPSDSHKLNFRKIMNEEEAKLNMKPTSPHGIMATPSSLPPLKSPPWAKTMALIPMADATRIPSLPASRESNKTYSLADFMAKPAPAPAKVVAARWCASHNQANKSDSGQSKSFRQIQQEEEAFRTRQHKSYGVEGRWFIERKERAGSISAIQEAEHKEREHQLQIEEQRQIEENIRRENETQKRRQKHKTSRDRKARDLCAKQHQSNDREGERKKLVSTDDGTGKSEVLHRSIRTCTADRNARKGKSARQKRSRRCPNVETQNR